MHDREAFDPAWQEHGLEALGLYAAGMAFVSLYMTDGFVSEQFVNTMAPDSDLPGKLVKVGKWSKVRGGWRIVDYLKHNMSRAQWEARSAAATKAANARHASGNA